MQRGHNAQLLQQASLCGAATARTMQCFDDGRRIMGGHLQQREGRSVRHPAPLFPISKRRPADADHERKCRLRLAEIGAHCLHIRRLERDGLRSPRRISPSWRTLANSS